MTYHASFSLHLWILQCCCSIMPVFQLPWPRKCSIGQMRRHTETSYNYHCVTYINYTPLNRDLILIWYFHPGQTIFIWFASDLCIKYIYPHQYAKLSGIMVTAQSSHINSFFWWGWGEKRLSEFVDNIRYLGDSTKSKYCRIS